jgi:hypothetical protein
MNTRKAAPVIVTVSLVVLMSGCAGAAAQGGQVQDYLSPAANAAELGLARGHVIVREDLSPTRVENRMAALAAEQAVQQPRGFSAEARRELHAQPAQSVTVEQPFSAEVWRELKGVAPVTVEQSFSAAAIRELKGSAPVAVNDYLSPLSSETPTPTPPADTVDDYLSPLVG